MKKDDLIKRLEELKELAEQAMENALEKPVYSDFSVAGILSLRDVKTTDKLLLIQFANVKSSGKDTLKSTEHWEDSGISTCQGYNKALRRLETKGYIKEVKRGYYQINKVY